jgi:hypothetical protein
MDTRLPMTTDDPLTVENPPNADLALTLGGWVSSLAGDARAVAEASMRGSAAPLRAGLRHLMHIAPLSRGIESLAMLEVAIVLRVTAQQAGVTDESSPIAQLQMETALIEAAFPEETAAIGRFCDGLVARERELIVRLEAARHAAISAEENPAQTSTEVVETSVEPTESHVSPMPAPDVAPPEGEAFEREASTGAEEMALPSTDAGSSSDSRDELIERVLTWTETYQPPGFGNRPHDLTRARAFIRTRIEAWSSSS